MRQWTVEGADANSGETRALKVLAQDEKQAEQIARKQGLLVSAIYAQQKTAESPQRQDDIFHDVPEAAKRLQTADKILTTIGWIYILGGIVAASASFFPMLSQPQTSQRDGTVFFAFGIAGLIYLLIGLGFGLLFMAAGAALRMLASIGIGVAELASRPQSGDN